MQHEIMGEKARARAGCNSWAARWAPAFAGDTVLKAERIEPVTWPDQIDRFREDFEL